MSMNLRGGGMMNIHVRILKGDRPILFAWLNSDSGAVEGCLVTCSCQGYSLDGKSQEDSHSLKMGMALERAEVLSLRYGSNATSVMREDYDEELENEKKKVGRVRKKHGSKKKKVDRLEKMEETRDGEDEKNVESGNVSRNENMETSRQNGGIAEDWNYQKEPGKEEMQKEKVGGEIPISSDEKMGEAPKVERSVDKLLAGESLNSLDARNRTSPREGDGKGRELLLSSREEESPLALAGLPSSTPMDGKPSTFGADEYSEPGAYSEDGWHTDAADCNDSGGEGSNDNSGMDAGIHVSQKEKNIRDISEVSASTITHEGHSYGPVEVDGVKLYIRDPACGMQDIMKLPEDGSEVDHVLGGSPFHVTDEGNVGNTVEVGNNEMQRELHLGIVGGKIISASQTGSSMVSPTSRTVSLDIPSGVVSPTFMTSGETSLLHTDVVQQSVTSTTAGQNLPRYVELSEPGETSNWSLEQEQRFLKSIEGFLSDPTLPASEVVSSVLHTRPGRDDDTRYSASIMKGEAAGPLNRVDRAKMDKYLAFREHKENEFKRKYHQYQDKKGVKFVLCELCAAPLTNKNLKLHMASVHNVKDKRVKRFPCKICDKNFLVLNNLKRHMDKHTGKRYKCTHCDKTYSQDHTRKLHELEHSGESRRTLRNPFANSKERLRDPGISASPGTYVNCEVCPKKLRPNSLKLHMKTHQNSYFTCEICSKVLRTSGKRDHLIRHTAEKKFACETCGKKFLTRASLAAHIRVHTNERPYKCTFCEDTFKSSHTRNTHERIHTGAKPYRCDRCDKNWRDRTTYWGHMKKHHPGEPLMYIRRSQQIQAVRDAAKAQLEEEHAARKEMEQLDLLTGFTPRTGQMIATEQPDNIVPLEFV